MTPKYRDKQGRQLASEGNQTIKGIGKSKAIIVPINMSEIVFSYKYVQLNDETFSINEVDSQYFRKLKERMSEISKYTYQRIIDDRRLQQVLRFHPITWTETTEKSFRLDNAYNDIASSNPWQFAITRSEHGRVHGFWIGNIFNIIWYDLEHKLYS